MTTRPDRALEVRDLRAGFGVTPVLHGVTFHVRKGEIAAILGLNGAGKSVTMRVVAGTLPAWDGRIFFKDVDVTALGAEDRVARGLAIVPQARQVFPNLTVEENLRLGAYPLRRREKDRYPQVLESVLERFPRVSERRKQLAGTLSGGEQAMLAIGRALMSEPSLLLVDEPSAGLSPVVVRQLFEILGQVNASGVTILLVEQNVAFTLEVSDRIHIMQTGQIVYGGDVASLDRRQLVDRLGIGRLLGARIDAVSAKGGRI